MLVITAVIGPGLAACFVEPVERGRRNKLPPLNRDVEKSASSMSRSATLCVCLLVVAFRTIVSTIAMAPV
jgi:hypothetical protein